jgi:predicted HD superfamily hydrolase involved in NAD metabolism
MDFHYYVNILKNRLSTARFEHSLRVVEKAVSMTKGLSKKEVNLDQEKLRLAALLHDYAKDMSEQELLNIAGQHGLITCQAEKKQPNLLHGPVGAFLCRRDLQIADEAILRAICYHTTGGEGMSLLDKIVFLADLLEPGRTYEGVDELRKICEDDLDEGLLAAFDGTLQFVLRRKLLIHPLTVQARNWHILEMNSVEEGYE